MKVNKDADGNLPLHLQCPPPPFEQVSYKYYKVLYQMVRTQTHTQNDWLSRSFWITTQTGTTQSSTGTAPRHTNGRRTTNAANIAMFSHKKNAAWQQMVRARIIPALQHWWVVDGDEEAPRVVKHSLQCKDGPNKRCWLS